MLTTFSNQLFNIYPIINPPKNYDPTLNPVGMDVGTTRCCVAVNRNDGINVVAIDNSDRPLPSYIGYEEKVPKCGQIVCSRIKHHFKSTVFDIKRIIGKSFGSIVIDPNWPFKVFEENGSVKISTIGCENVDILLSPEEITAVLIKHMKKEVESFQGQSIFEAVITVPAAFNQTQINATIEAAKLAELEIIHILPEPIAACLTYASQQQIPENSTVLLFDLGGGTLDVCIVKIEHENLHILKSCGDQYLGGRDFDTILMNHFLAVLKEGYQIDLINDFDNARLLKRYKLMLLCQEIKHDLQTAESAWLDVSDIDPNFDTQIIIKRDDFEKLSAGLLLRIKFKILESINSLNLGLNDIDFVLQVDPDWAVAYGATLYSYYLKTTSVNEVMEEAVPEVAYPQDTEPVQVVQPVEKPTQPETPSAPIHEELDEKPRLHTKDKIKRELIRFVKKV
uniref:Heat shock protein 70 n=1 Tax=Panagrolaimus davidi TaxID=227884 RepID=A0A914P370_9BILA